MKLQPRSDDRKYLVIGIIWAVVLVCYSVIRALAVGITLSRYGVNPYVFFVIDVTTAGPYAYGQVQVVRYFRIRKYAIVQRWLALVVLMFLAPYAYLFVSGASMPKYIYPILGVFVLLFAIAGGATLWRRLKSPSV